MQIFCIENEHTTPAVRYTIDYLLERSGFFYQWKPNISGIDGPGLVLLYGNETDTHKFPAIQLPAAIDPLLLPDQEITWDEFSINGEALPVVGLSKAYRGIIPFDVVATVFFFLSLLYERDYRHPDDADKNHTNHPLYRYGRFKRPVVDIICAWFTEKIERIFREQGFIYLRKSAFPEGRKMGLSFTHDVDITRAANPAKRILQGWFSHSKKRILQEAEAAVWAFDRLLPFYNNKGWRATFNFIARPWEGRHYRYNVKSNRFRSLIRRLETEGHEVGLHPSRFTFEHSRRFLQEKKRLEEVVGKPLHGMRQHYLRGLYPDLWRAAENAGLSYDCSLAYRRRAGYRAGTGGPFTCFDWRDNEILNCTEFPTAFFESSLPGGGTDVDLAKEAIRSFFETAQRYGTVLTVLWHPSNMYSHPYWSRLWDEITIQAEQYKPFIAPLWQQLQWKETRRALRLVSVDEKANTITLVIEHPRKAMPGGVRISGKVLRATDQNGNRIPWQPTENNMQEIIFNSEELRLEIALSKSERTPHK